MAPANALQHPEQVRLFTPWPVRFRMPLYVYCRPLGAIAARGGTPGYWHALTSAVGAGGRATSKHRREPRSGLGLGATRTWAGREASIAAR